MVAPLPWTKTPAISPRVTTVDNFQSIERDAIGQNVNSAFDGRFCTACAGPGDAGIGAENGDVLVDQTVSYSRRPQQDGVAIVCRCNRAAHCAVAAITVAVDEQIGLASR